MSLHVTEVSQIRREDAPGTIYLLHFERPFHHARHYLGWTEGESLEARLQAHRSGQGAKLTAAVGAAGIGYLVSRTWKGSRHDERKFKRMKNTARLCPTCKEGV